MSFTKHSIQTIAVRVFMLLFILIAGVITARWLGPEGEGVFVLLILIKNFAFRFGNFGFGSAFAYYVAKKEVSVGDALRIMYAAGIIASILTIIILLIVWRRGFSPWRDIDSLLFYISLPMVVLIFFNNFMLRILSGQLRIFAMNIANLIMHVSLVVLLIVLVVILQLDIIGAVLSVVLSDLLAFFYLVFQCKKHSSGFDVVVSDNGSRVSVFDMWRYGRWNYLLMFSGFFIEELPLMLLKMVSLKTSAVGLNISVGLFSKARGLGRQSRIVALPVAQVLFPYTAASKEQLAIKRTNTLSRNYILVMIPIALIMVLCIKPVVYFLYGSSFMPAVKIFYAIAPGICLWPFGHFLGVHVAASGKPKIVFFSSCVVLVAAIVICWFLIPAYGAFGAGLSVSVICLVQTLVRVWVYKKVTGTGFKELLLFQKQDLEHYIEVLRFLRWPKLKRTDTKDER